MNAYDIAKWQAHRTWTDRYLSVETATNLREGWCEAYCWSCGWQTTGTESVCEDAASEHAWEQHRDDWDTYAPVPVPAREV